jgi:hypothetical protein
MVSSSSSSSSSSRSGSKGGWVSAAGPKARWCQVGSFSVQLLRHVQCLKQLWLLQKIKQQQQQQ